MFAWIAAVLFGLSLLVQLFDIGTNDVINVSTLNTAGFLFVALHLAGWLPRTAWRGRGRR
jgi:hypothetical protein